jgi:hypothetical protein
MQRGLAQYINRGFAMLPYIEHEIVAVFRSPASDRSATDTFGTGSQTFDCMQKCQLTLHDFKALGVLFVPVSWR